MLLIFCFYNILLLILSRKVLRLVLISYQFVSVITYVAAVNKDTVHDDIQSWLNYNFGISDDEICINFLSQIEARRR